MEANDSKQVVLGSLSITRTGPRANNPKQAVIDSLSNTRSRLRREEQGYVVKKDTILFLKEKHVPGFYSCALTYTSTTEQEFVLHASVVKKTDDEWEYAGGVQGTIETKFAVTKYDRQTYGSSQPWMKLSFTEKDGYFFIYGSLIPNGHDVTKVCMISASGQKEEDQVESGFVFFTSHHPFPAEFEFYDSYDIVLGKQVLNPQFP